MLVLCWYTVVYILYHTSDKGKMFLRQSIWSTNKILKEIAVFSMWKCEHFLSSLAPLARIFIDFFFLLNLSVNFNARSAATSWKRWCRQMYFESWKYMFLRRSIASLARAVLCNFFVGTFGVLPSPNTKKLATYASDNTHFSTRCPPPHWRTGGGGGWAWGKLAPSIKLNHGLFSIPYKLTHIVHVVKSKFPS